MVGKLPNEMSVRDLDGPYRNYASAQHAVLDWVEKGYVEVSPVSRVRERPGYKGISKKR